MCWGASTRDYAVSGVKGTAMGLWPAGAGPLLWSRALVMAKHTITSRKSSFGQIIKIPKKALTLFLLKHLQFSHLPVLHPGSSPEKDVV